jgi:hypothetical protein
MPRLALALAAFLFPALLAQAGQIRVPTDQPTLAAALAVASPGDVILVQTTSAQGRATVTQPVTILGDPILNMSATVDGCLPGPLLALNGPGSGRLTIANAAIASDADCFQAVLPIGGGGFEQLALIDVQVPEPVSGATGYGLGTSGVRISGIPYVLVERSVIHSSQNNTDGCNHPGSGLGIANHIALDVGNSATLFVHNSTIRGGKGGNLCSAFGAGCPASVALLGGEGASGVRCGILFAGGGLIAPGTPSTYLAYPGAPLFPTPDECHTYTSYPGVISNSGSWTTPGGGSFSTAGPPRIGQNWTIFFVMQAAPSYAFVSPSFSAPLALPGMGLLFLDPSSYFPLGFFAGWTVGSKNYPIPNDPNLIGTPLSLQVFNANWGLLDPVLDVIRP